MSQDSTTPTPNGKDSSGLRPEESVAQNQRLNDAGEPVMPDMPAAAPEQDAFWQNDATLRVERMAALTRRIEEQRREEAALEEERRQMQARLEDEQRKMADLMPESDPVKEPSFVEESPQPAMAAPVPPVRASERPASSPGPVRNVPSDFGFEDEHPLVKLPFTLTVEGRKFTGGSISFTNIKASGEPGSPLGKGGRYVGLLKIPFDGFTITLQPELSVHSEASDGGIIFQFTDPTGPHLPQLRYILNSVIAGDVVGVDGMMHYSGPTQPATSKPVEPPSMRDRVRSIMVATLSTALVLVAAYVVFSRYTTGFEMHPVYVDKDGQSMRATTAGQLTYLDTNAKAGDVLYAVNSNTGDVLNFQMPCDCDVSVGSGVAEGMTVLPTDLILTVFPSSADIRVQTLMSIEGLSRAMNGDQVHMDMIDGRKIPVTVQASDATRAASMRGDLFVPVNLVPASGTLSEADIGKSARLRLSKSLFGIQGLN